MWFEDNSISTLVEEFGRSITMMNPVPKAQFFEAIYTSIFKQLFVTKTTGGGLLEPVLMYFRTVEINGWGILYLYYLV